MKEYIAREVKTDTGGYIEPVSELVRCKDCKWYLPNYTKSPFDTDGFDRWGGLANCQNEMGVAECNEEDYCSFGERRES